MTNDLQKLDDLIILDQRFQKHKVMRFGFELNLSYANGQNMDLRMAAVDVARSYWQDAGPVVDAFMRAGATRYSPIKDGAFDPYYRKRLQQEELSDDDKAITLIDSTDGKDNNPPAQHQFFLRIGRDPVADGDPRYERSNLTASWPVARCLEASKPVVDLVLEWCNRLHPEQGTAGIAPIAERGMLFMKYREYAPFLKRFPGLEFQFPLLSMPLWGGIRTVNWLTIIGDRYVEALGGRAALTGMVPDDVTLHDYDGGVLIQAGAEPELGDVNNGIWPEKYRNINAILRPLRFEDYKNAPMDLIRFPDPMDRYQETLAWVRRFDRS